MLENIKNFIWDTEKNKINIQKHGVTFAEAESVFYDKLAVVAEDEKHSQDEDRFLIVGKSRKSRLILACYCIRNTETVRIISARKAEKLEIEWYKEGL